jgi:hypothetical protein
MEERLVVVGLAILGTVVGGFMARRLNVREISDADGGARRAAKDAAQAVERRDHATPAPARHRRRRGQLCCRDTVRIPARADQ